MTTLLTHRPAAVRGSAVSKVLDFVETLGDSHPTQELLDIYAAFTTSLTTEAKQPATPLNFITGNLIPVMAEAALMGATFDFMYERMPNTSPEVHPVQHILYHLVEMLSSLTGLEIDYLMDLSEPPLTADVESISAALIVAVEEPTKRFGWFRDGFWELVKTGQGSKDVSARERLFRQISNEMWIYDDEYYVLGKLL